MSHLHSPAPPATVRAASTTVRDGRAGVHAGASVARRALFPTTHAPHSHSATLRPLAPLGMLREGLRAYSAVQVSNPQIAA